MSEVPDVLELIAGRTLGLLPLVYPSLVHWMADASTAEAPAEPDISRPPARPDLEQPAREQTWPRRDDPAGHPRQLVGRSMRHDGGPSPTPPPGRLSRAPSQERDASARWTPPPSFSAVDGSARVPPGIPVPEPEPRFSSPGQGGHHDQSGRGGQVSSWPLDRRGGTHEAGHPASSASLEPEHGEAPERPDAPRVDGPAPATFDREGPPADGAAPTTGVRPTRADDLPDAETSPTVSNAEPTRFGSPPPQSSVDAEPSEAARASDGNSTASEWAGSQPIARSASATAGSSWVGQAADRRPRDQAAKGRGSKSVAPGDAPNRIDEGRPVQGEGRSGASSAVPPAGVPDPTVPGNERASGAGATRLVEPTTTRDKAPHQTSASSASPVVAAAVREDPGFGQSAPEPSDVSLGRRGEDLEENRSWRLAGRSVEPSAAHEPGDPETIAEPTLTHAGSPDDPALSGRPLAKQAELPETGSKEPVLRHPVRSSSDGFETNLQRPAEPSSNDSERPVFALLAEAEGRSGIGHARPQDGRPEEAIAPLQSHRDPPSRHPSSPERSRMDVPQANRRNDGVTAGAAPADGTSPPLHPVFVATSTAAASRRIQPTSAEASSAAEGVAPRVVSAPGDTCRSAKEASRPIVRARICRIEIIRGSGREEPPRIRGWQRPVRRGGRT